MNYKKIKYLFLISIGLVFYLIQPIKKPSVVISGYIKKEEGLGQLSLVLLEELFDSIDFSFIHTQDSKFSDLSDTVLNILSKKQQDMPAIGLTMDLLWHKHNFNIISFLPNSFIKIAISMLESSLIPSAWVNILNENFDAVCVPDEYFIRVYKDSGVIIPIFVIPCPIRLNTFLEEVHELPTGQFVFGMSATMIDRKNHEMIIEAFAQEFGNNPKFKLILQTKGGLYTCEKRISDLIKKYNYSNIVLINKTLSDQEYIDLMKTFNCYVFLSQGEGFSITPRQAMALGLPVILTNNTAQKTLCNSGYVLAVRSDLLVDAAYELFDEHKCGYHFNCTLEDARLAMRDMYNNYKKYRELAKKGRAWVKQYDISMVKAKYISFLLPKPIFLGTENIINDNALITNSISLYNKYKQYFEL